jgi:hypothetical protein
MNRTTWLQDRRMEKFCDVLSRWERKDLSALEAAEILGVSERQFRRHRRRDASHGLECEAFSRAHPRAARVPLGLHLNQDAVAHGGAGGARRASRGAPSQAAAQTVRRHDAAPGRQPVCLACRTTATRSDCNDGRRHQHGLRGVPGRGGRHGLDLWCSAGSIHSEGLAGEPLNRPRQSLLFHREGG